MTLRTMGAIMNLRQLRHLVAVVELGGFARAAQACNISQPSISASIAQLEANTGTLLLERGAFGARPTEAGKALEARARLILAEVRRASDEILAIRNGEGGSVAIGIGTLFEHKIVPDVLAEFAAARRHVSTAVTVGITGELHEMLARGELDMTLSSPPGWTVSLPGLAVEVLESTRDVVVAAADHPIWDSEEMTLDILARQPWAISARVNQAATSFFKSFSEAGVRPPSTVVRTDSIPLLTQFVLKSGYLSVVSPHFAAGLSASGLARSRLVDALSLPRIVCLATRTGSPLTTAAADLAARLRNACAKALSPHSDGA